MLMNKLSKCVPNIKTAIAKPFSSLINIDHPLAENRLSYVEPRQAWLENFDTIDEKKLGIINLHPEIFAARPRIDVIHQNVRWQQLYKFVSFANTKVRSEVRGGGRKPWPQKGMGRSRHSSIRSPLFKGGGVIHGPRSPTPHFYMLPFYKRVLGLTSTLSVKLAQDDLHIVNDLELPTDEYTFLEEMAKSRNWGPSVLFINDVDIMPRNITVATDIIKHMNIMPVYGLNVYSMLKHDTLVLTKSAVETLVDKLLVAIHKNGKQMEEKFKLSQQ
ncbi:large ribosomal subunit protein uL4m [Atheta coriaria]|uniref:large ribosomal subunit protein uL4m n=1 Tax=Dalotia coriaria TaxID=877792 RepID=UPI0031F42BF8